MTSKKVQPLTYLLVTIIVMIPLHYLIPIIEIIAMPWRLFGMLALIAGVTIIVIADSMLKLKETTVKPFEESTFLVTTGVYGFSRNPMYLGYVIMLAGMATMFGSLMIFVPVVLFAVLINRIFIVEEEKMLEKTFGSSWIIYKNKVRCWI